MATNKTVATNGSVDDFLAPLDDEQRSDSRVLIGMMSDVTGEPPVMWGTSIIGFGATVLKSPATGREVDWLKIGFSPRKGKLSLYITADASHYTPLLDEVGKYKIGKGCIYINKLADVDTDKLRTVIGKIYKDGYLR